MTYVELSVKLQCEDGMCVGSYIFMFFNSCRKLILKTVPVVPHQSEVGTSLLYSHQKQDNCSNCSLTPISSVSGVYPDMTTV